MPLIDRTYFEGPIILNVTGDSEALVDNAIALYEPEYLQKVLGRALYDAFTEGLGSESHSYFDDRFSDDFVLSPYDDRWDWILNGHTFTYGGATYYWPGLTNSGKQSPVAQYVYYKYRVDNATSTNSTGGETAPVHENATPASMGPKLCRAWNKMVEWNRTLYYMLAYLTDDNDDVVYPEWETPQAYADTLNRWALFQTINTFGI